MWQYIVRQRDRRWTIRVEQIDDELLGCAAATYDLYAVDELRKAAQDKATAENDRWSGQRQKLIKLATELDKAWTPKLYLGRNSKDDFVKEMDSVVRVPGWANIWTQPIINRIDMLATGVRTMIGVKVFGNDLDQIQKVADEVAEALRSVPGAVDVFPDQIKGKGYLEIRPDRDRAARYGVNVGDIWDVVEVALGGKAITTTVEGRQRFPVRVRYARASARTRKT